MPRKYKDLEAVLLHDLDITYTKLLALQLFMDDIDHLTEVTG